MINSIWETPFIVVDVETTGSSAEKNRIIEIGCVSVIGGEIISEYESLVNSKQFIPYFIQQMTGITNEILFTAPPPQNVFAEVSKIFEIPNAVFVGHNAAFDYGFVHEELIRNGYHGLQNQKLCTLKLARRIIPSLKRKNVGSLSEYLGIQVRNRHRALGDAYATAQILIDLLEKTQSEHNVNSIEELLSFQNKPIRHFRPSTKSHERVKEKLEQLPDEPGVYYFLNRFKNIIYIGKAKSLKSRVKSYFQNDSLTSRKISEMVKRIYDVVWECTGTELAALLLESKELKQKKPPYNTADKIFRNFYFIKLTTNENFPRIEICYSIEQDKAEYFGPFGSSRLTSDLTTIIEKEFKLRKCINPIHPAVNNRPCFYYHIKRCHAPCFRIEAIKPYQLETDKVKNFLSGKSDGVISHLEKRMYDFSDELKFEEALVLKNQISQLKKLLLRKQQVPASVNENNMVLLFPVSSREKTIELLMIRYGKLFYQQIIGRKAPLEDVFNELHNTFYNSNSQNHFNFTIEDIDEMKIISSWIYRRNGDGKIIYIT
ncbi:MAG: DEDD exonuclease domain-containing protein, partial [FCB group bacterium]